jgi:quercetin dioxygenase-like cupin family protein
LPPVSFRVARPQDFEWITRPHEPDEPARYVAELSDRLGLARSRGNVWRYEPGAKGVRHRHRLQEETFVVLTGTLSMYLGEPPERVDVEAGGVVHVEPGTPIQSVNHGPEELVVYACGTPPETKRSELLDSAV